MGMFDNLGSSALQAISNQQPAAAPPSTFKAPDKVGKTYTRVSPTTVVDENNQTYDLNDPDAVKYLQGNSDAQSQLSSQTASQNQSTADQKKQEAAAQAKAKADAEAMQAAKDSANKKLPNLANQIQYTTALSKYGYLSDAEMASANAKDKITGKPIYSSVDDYMAKNPGTVQYIKNGSDLATAIKNGSLSQGQLQNILVKDFGYTPEEAKAIDPATLTKTFTDTANTMGSRNFGTGTGQSGGTKQIPEDYEHSAEHAASLLAQQNAQNEIDSSGSTSTPTSTSTSTSTPTDGGQVVKGSVTTPLVSGRQTNPSGTTAPIVPKSLDDKKTEESPPPATTNTATTNTATTDTADSTKTPNSGLATAALNNIGVQSSNQANYQDAFNSFLKTVQDKYQNVTPEEAEKNAFGTSQGQANVGALASSGGAQQAGMQSARSAGLSPAQAAMLGAGQGAQAFNTAYTSNLNNLYGQNLGQFNTQARQAADNMTAGGGLATAQGGNVNNAIGQGANVNNSITNTAQTIANITGTSPQSQASASQALDYLKSSTDQSTNTNTTAGTVAGKTGSAAVTPTTPNK